MLRYRIRAATSVINRLAQSVGRYGFSEETSSVNRREIYNLLFQSAWAAIKQTVESEQGYQPAALLVLHSWNQKLIDHREKPSWYDIMNSPARPKWYQRPAEYPRHLARRDKNPIESAVKRSGHAMLAPPTKLNAQSIPLPPAPG